MRFVVVTGMGRSGSTFLAHLLNQGEAQEARHEHFADRTFLHLSFYAPDHPFLRHRLESQKRALLASPPAATFVDVNAWLRHGAGVVREVLDGPAVFHLARDGRRVVGSLYRNKSYTPVEKSIPLLPDEPAALERWEQWSRFEKLCWLWQRTVRGLMRQQIPSLQLERIVSDFAYLDERLLRPAGLALERRTWESLRHQPRNPSRLRLVNLLRRRPVRLHWSAEHERRFQTICGEAMQELGYA